MGAAASVALLSIGLFGCAASPPQEVTVHYFDASTKHVVEVVIPVVKCSKVGAALLFGSGEVRTVSGPPSKFTAVKNAEVGSAAVVLMVTDDLMFVSMADYVADKDSITFDSLEGQLGPVDESGEFSGIIDDSATLDGVLKCTE